MNHKAVDPKMVNEQILETIVEQFTAELRAGRHPDIEHFQKQHPELAEEIGNLLSSIAMIEQLKDNAVTRCLNGPTLDSVGQPSSIGNYKILHEIGRGGMGIVFAAVHESLGRRVAIKVLPTPPIASSGHVERFRREAQAAARLHHTNIVSVFGVGQGEGFHYYVMDYVDGQSLNRVIAQLKETEAAGTSYLEKRNGQKQSLGISSDQPSSVDQPSSEKQPIDKLPIGAGRFKWSARLGERLADALEHAHSANILHRDIKPSNIILDQQGTIWITDFGLAKDGLSDSQLTKTGEVVGTPQYLPPEALDGHYDQRSETYAVGLVLYEMVTLRPAYSSGTAAELIRAIATTSPAPVRKVDPSIPLDLATIIEKAVSREPEARYQTAAQLKRDLRAFVEHRPISARRPGPLESTVRWARRNPLVAGLTAVSLSLLVLVAVSATIGYWMTTTALENEATVTASLREQQQKTDKARQQAEENLQKMQLEFDRAESNVTVTIAAFDEMFKQIISRGAKNSVDMEFDSLREISGMETSLTKQDAEFLDHMLKFYQQFAELNQDNDKLHIESARAFRRVGNIYQLVGQLQPAIDAYKSSLGLLPDQQAEGSPPEGLLAIDQAAIDDFQNMDKTELLMRVQTQNELSAALRRSGEFGQSLEWNQRSIDLLEQSSLVESDPHVRLELARTMSSLGFNQLRGLATTVSQRSPPDRLGMRPDRPGGPPGRFGPPPDRLGPQDELGPPHELAPPERFGSSEKSDRPGGLRPPGRPDRERSERRPPDGRRPENMARMHRAWQRENQPLNERAIEILNDLIADDPENAEYLSTRATCYCTLAAIHLNQQPDKAVEYRGLAIGALEHLTQRYSEQSEYRYLLALACGLVSGELDDEESKSLQRGGQLCLELVERQPSMLDYHHLLANLKIKLAGHYLQHEQPQEAYQELRSARASMIQLWENANSDFSYRPTLGLFVSELHQLQQVSREQGNQRIAVEINQILQQLRPPDRGRRPPT